MDELSRQVLQISDNQETILKTLNRFEREQLKLEKNTFEKNQEEKNAAKIRLMFSELEKGQSATEILQKHTVYSGNEVPSNEKDKSHSITLTTSIVGAFVTICVAIFTFCGNQKQIDVTQKQGEAQIAVAKEQTNSQQEQKKIELQIAKIERMEKLITSLSSDKPEEKKFATFAAISLEIGDFDKFVLSSLADIKDKDTLNALLGRIKDRNDLQDELKNLSQYYSDQAEKAYENNDRKNAFNLAKFALKIYSINAQAHYRIARKLQEDGVDPSEEFLQALEDLKNAEKNADSRPGLEISINERLGDYFYSINRETEGKKYFAQAKEILDKYKNKNDDDKKRLEIIEACIASKSNCKFE